VHGKALGPVPHRIHGTPNSCQGRPLPWSPGGASQARRSGEPIKAPRASQQNQNERLTLVHAWAFVSQLLVPKNEFRDIYRYDLWPVRHWLDRHVPPGRRRAESSPGCTKLGGGSVRGGPGFRHGPACRRGGDGGGVGAPGGADGGREPPGGLAGGLGLEVADLFPALRLGIAKPAGVFLADPPGLLGASARGHPRPAAACPGPRSLDRSPTRNRGRALSRKSRPPWPGPGSTSRPSPWLT